MVLEIFGYIVRVSRRKVTIKSNSPTLSTTLCGRRGRFFFWGGSWGIRDVFNVDICICNEGCQQRLHSIISGIGCDSPTILQMSTFSVPAIGVLSPLRRHRLILPSDKQPIHSQVEVLYNSWSGIGSFDLLTEMNIILIDQRGEEILRRTSYI